MTAIAGKLNLLDSLDLLSDMLQTSQDLFFIVAAIAIIWVSVFLCWALYRIAIFLRTINTTTVEVHARIAAIDEWLEITKERIMKTFAFVTTASKGIETLLRALESRRKKSPPVRKEKVGTEEGRSASV